MKIALRSGLPAVALLAAAALSPAAQAGESKGRPWTLEDILTVPEVNEIALSDNGRLAIYAAEIADLDAGKPRSHIRIVDVETGRTKELLTVDTIKSLRSVPGTQDWSALVDLGEGQQLYRIDTEGKLLPLIVNPNPVPVGKADMSFPLGGGIRPSHIGILDYDWSPDGKWLWYSQLRAKTDGPRVRFDREVTALLGRRRSTIDVEVDYFLRGPEGNTTKIMTRPSTDRVATRGGGRILWRGDEIQFRIETSDGTLGGAFEFLAWNRVNKTVRTLAKQRDLLSMSILGGPRGGQLSTSGVGRDRELLETSAEGRSHSYGRVAFDIGDSRSVGWKSSRDGRRVVIGTRGLGDARYGLALIDKRGVRELRGDASLTRCGFDGMLRAAICVEEGMSRPPRLVRVSLYTDKIADLGPISPRHEEIEPLQAIARTFVNRDGYWSSGYVLLPRGHRAGDRHPAVVVTHGTDADDRFAEPANQWNYPVQLLAERGYVVLLLNDPSPGQSKDLMDAMHAWLRGKGPPDPETVQQKLWLTGVHSFEDAVTELAAEGLIDPARVGIAGYSRGSQMVNVTVTNSNMFRAASSGDGGFLEPAGYATGRSSYDAVYGGAPLGENIERWRRFAPSLNAGKVCAAVLQQVASASPSQIELFEALRAAGVATQISYYPGATAASDETHVFYLTSNRLRAMRENIAWFDYWLLGQRDADAPFPDQMANWDRLKHNRQARCPAEP